MKNRNHRRKAGAVWAVLLLYAAALFTAPVRSVTASVEPSGAAERIALTVISNNPSFDCRKVLDDNEKTRLYSPEKNVFSITAEQPFSHLYLKFEKETDWVLTLPDGTKLDGGEENYIHRYLPLGQEVTSCKLTLPPYGALTDVYAFTDGTPPDWVQLWEPPCERADLMVMPTHADDEFLWFGGAIPYYAGELGYEVQVVYLTNHNNATVRNHERLNGLWKTGVRHYPVVSDFLDDRRSKKNVVSASDLLGYNKVMTYQVMLLRRFRPRVVLAQDIRGEYGHGAHILNAKTVLRALELTDDPAQFPDSAEKYGTCRIEKCYLHLWKEKPITVNWSDKKLSRFGGKSALDMAIEGFECHKSQVIAMKVLESGPYDCRQFGLAYTTVGDDTPNTNDFFEHIDMSDKLPAEEAAISSAPVEEPVTPSDVPDDRKAEKTPFRAGWFLAAVFAVLAILAVLGVFALTAVGRKRPER